MSGEQAFQSATERQVFRLGEVRREFGDAHPQTLTAMLDLAEALWAQGRLMCSGLSPYKLGSRLWQG